MRQEPNWILKMITICYKVKNKRGKKNRKYFSIPLRIVFIVWLMIFVLVKRVL